MDQELLALLKQNLAVSRETNEILKKMHSAEKWSRFFRVVYWLVILGVAGSVYYYLREPLQQMIGVYSGILDRFDALQANSPDVSALKTLLEKFGE